MKNAKEVIRRIKEEDRKALEDLVKVMLGNENVEEVAEAVVSDFYSNDIYNTFVIEVESSVKGFGVIKLNQFEGAENVGEIVWLGVNKDDKRTGLGSKLVRYIEQVAKENGMRKIYIKTNVGNKVGVCFWIMQGYMFEARLLDFTAKSYDDYYLGNEI